MKIKFANLDFTPKEVNEQQKTLRAVFSTGDVDRHGEIVDQKSWILDDFLKNPVVLFGHDHSQPPVGMITGLGYNQQGNLEGEVKFAADEYPFANVIWNLYKGGFMKAFSVGFSAGSVDVVDGQVILRDNTLYEISTVSVPANAMALAKSKGLDVTALEAKFVEQRDNACPEHEKECECNKKPAAVVTPEPEAPVVEEVPAAEAVVPAEEAKKDDAEVAPAEAEVETPAVETPVELTEDEKDEAAVKAIEAIAVSLKEGRVLSSKNRQAISAALDALQAVLDADTGKSAATLSTTVTIPVFEIKAKTVNKHSKNRQINKAIRQLLKAKQ